jgi:hypothetical protein
MELKATFDFVCDQALGWENGEWKVRKAEGRVICSKRSMACVPSVLAS